MCRSLLWIIGVVILSPGLFVNITTEAKAQRSRQSYSKWQYHSQKKYYYRNYYYKPNQHHYGIYYPSRGRKMYMYNPSKKRYWGYYDFASGGYSLLPEDQRKQ